MKKCRYCSQPIGDHRQVCWRPECRAKRCAENQTRYEAKRRAAGAKKPRYEVKVVKPKTKIVSCLRCELTFISRIEVKGSKGRTAKFTEVGNGEVLLVIYKDGLQLAWVVIPGAELIDGLKKVLEE